MAKRVKVPVTARRDVCAFSVDAWKRRSPDALMAEWARRGASAPGRTVIQGTIKNWLANYATYKRVKALKTPAGRRAVKTYADIARRLEADIREARKACALETAEARRKWGYVPWED